MSYERVTPRARQGTTGICEEMDVTAGNGVWIAPPDRVAAVTIAVHIPTSKTAQFTIETSCNRPETIGDNGAGGAQLRIAIKRATCAAARPQSPKRDFGRAHRGGTSARATARIGRDGIARKYRTAPTRDTPRVRLVYAGRRLDLAGRAREISRFTAGA